MKKWKQSVYSDVSSAHDKLTTSTLLLDTTKKSAKTSDLLLIREKQTISADWSNQWLLLQINIHINISCTCVVSHIIKTDNIYIRNWPSSKKNNWQYVMRQNVCSPLAKCLLHVIANISDRLLANTLAMKRQQIDYRTSNFLIADFIFW